jgi:hypothetical protein
LRNATPCRDCRSQNATVNSRKREPNSLEMEIGQISKAPLKMNKEQNKDKKGGL